MLRRAKLSLLRVSKSLGFFRLAGSTAWRDRRLLILCYHGISIEDEHEWAPGLYMSAEDFEGRLKLLRRRHCSVLPLAEGVRRLYAGTLPPRSVVMTFDDGMFDFHRQAWPRLAAHDVPATVYLTTYYCEKNLPIFPLVCSYLLWKRRGEVVPAPESLGGGALDLRTGAARRLAHARIVEYAEEHDLSGDAKDALAAELASALAVSYADIRRKRLLHIMNPAEVAEVAKAGIDIQLHSHHHRSPLDRESYRREISENGARIRSLAGTEATHFCYPSGIWKPPFASWLAEENVVSATTCEAGIASAGSEPLRLPRILDHSEMTPLEFDSWLTGSAALLPRRRLRLQDVDRQGKLVGTPRPAPV